MQNEHDSTFSRDLGDQLSKAAEDADRLSDWPAKSWLLLHEHHVLGRSIPSMYGGGGLGAIELLRGMEEIASCCLTTAFLLSQREAAIRHLIRGPSHVKDQFLPRLADSSAYATVGLSQLTTSRQHLGPTLHAASQPSGGYCLNGEIPWVTGADQAIGIVAGAMLPDASQVLVVIPSEKLEEMIEEPLRLAALAGSRTSVIQCRSVNVESDHVLAGPTENVLGKLGGGGLDTSCLAIGLASAATQFIQHEAESRRELISIAQRFDSAIRDARQRLHELAESTGDPDQTLALRLDCTKIVLRATQASLMVAKGHGFVASHPAQRWARQALFFLVWSCPRPVAHGLLTDLTNWL